MASRATVNAMRAAFARRVSSGPHHGGDGGVPLALLRAKSSVQLHCHRRLSRSFAAERQDGGEVPRRTLSLQQKMEAAEDGGAELRRTLSRQAAVDVDGMFDLMDSDQNGVVDRHEFRHAMQAIGTDQLLSLQRALPRGELSATSGADAAAGAKFEEEDGRGFVDMFTARMIVTTEVMVSKIFPAGFGWQLSSCVAEGQFGFAADSAAFALTTGVGDGLGVFCGHSLYMALKGMVKGGVIVKNEVQTGVLLGSAAFCSGTAWQPLVDLLTNSGLHFTGVAGGTVVGCGMAFFAGLRLGRVVYSGIFDGVEENTYGNLKADGQLSLAVGGATGAFVATDVGQVGNWFSFFRIEEGTADLVGSAVAGSSTAFGFAALQTPQNMLITDGKNWVD